MEKTLVVMAAGIGSRFGGLKQVEPVGPNGEFIIDYSVYDAKRAGFQKIVFVIKKELEDIFKDTIGKRIEDKIKVEYAFQEIDDIPNDVKYLASLREKPWGTVQAILCAKNYVDGDFVVINADDFYGYDSYVKAINFLNNNHEENVYASINFPFIATASKFGSVKRAVCFSDDFKVNKLVESKITVKDNYALCEPLNGDDAFKIELNNSVAVNMFVFKNSFFKYLEEYFNNYFKQDKEVILKNEILLSELIKEKLDKKEIVLKSIVSDSKWLGVTYKEDLEGLKISIGELIKKGEYPQDLWG